MFDLQRSEILSQRHRAAQWIKIQTKDPTICFLQETDLACKYICTENKEFRKESMQLETPKESGMQYFYQTA